MAQRQPLAQQPATPASSMDVDQVATALGIGPPNEERRMIFAKSENTRHFRHAQILDRWPILAESWARSVERTRLAAVDRTPGAATFGR
jgi:hypothetical protein